MCVCILLLVAAGATLAGSPKESMDLVSYDFGFPLPGSTLTHSFVVTNHSDRQLQFLNIETSCGCTAALVSDKTIAPGASGKIKVTFSSRGYSGEVTKYIYVDTDDPDAPRLQLKISAAVDVPPQPRIDLDKYTYDAGLLVEGESLVSEVAVKNRGELELRFECELAGATFSSGGKPVKWPVKVAAGKDAVLGISLSLENRSGLVREFVLFKTNDPLRSTISMNLNGYIVTKDQLKKLFEKYKSVIK